MDQYDNDDILKLLSVMVSNVRWWWWIELSKCSVYLPDNSSSESDNEQLQTMMMYCNRRGNITAQDKSKHYHQDHSVSFESIQRHVWYPGMIDLPPHYYYHHHHHLMMMMMMLHSDERRRMAVINIEVVASLLSLSLYLFHSMFESPIINKLIYKNIFIPWSSIYPYHTT